MLAGVTGSIDKILPMIYELGVEVDDIKISFSEIKPFNRLRIKIKEEIISLGNAEKSNPNNEVGVYVDPIDWNEIIMKPMVNILTLFYSIFSDNFGLSIIIFTILIK